MGWRALPESRGLPSVPRSPSQPPPPPSSGAWGSLAAPQPAAQAAAAAAAGRSPILKASLRRARGRAGRCCQRFARVRHARDTPQPPRRPLAPARLPALRGPGLRTCACRSPPPPSLPAPPGRKWGTGPGGHRHSRSLRPWKGPGRASGHWQRAPCDACTRAETTSARLTRRPPTRGSRGCLSCRDGALLDPEGPAQGFREALAGSEHLGFVAVLVPRGPPGQGSQGTAGGKARKAAKPCPGARTVSPGNGELFAPNQFSVDAWRLWEVAVGRHRSAKAQGQEACRGHPCHPLQSREASLLMASSPEQTYFLPSAGCSLLYIFFSGKAFVCPSGLILRLSRRLVITKLSAKDQWERRPWVSRRVMPKYG